MGYAFLGGMSILLGFGILISVDVSALSFLNFVDGVARIALAGALDFVGVGLIALGMRSKEA
ncbi:hypothetical protein Dehly_0843 [Dehalogenimonas lykanthroporepellens BL-DC-9]|jgi:hypothetical protein|nr:hypothetical protein Dehly_0843 [Dehalogenimonas lykanthroporepellens BL-DC-9]